MLTRSSVAQRLFPVDPIFPVDPVRQLLTSIDRQAQVLAFAGLAECSTATAIRHDVTSILALIGDTYAPGEVCVPPNPI